MKKLWCNNKVFLFDMEKESQSYTEFLKANNAKPIMIKVVEKDDDSFKLETKEVDSELLQR